MSARGIGAAYITAAGGFLPNEPVDNDRMEALLGLVGGEPSRYRHRVLMANGIRSRHYALAEDGTQTHLNEEMAALAVEAALKSRGIAIDQLGMLALGTTIGDSLMPGFANMVHGRLGGPPMEILSSGGVCCAGMGALRAAVNAVRLGEHKVAVAGASELSSAVIRGSRFERESELAPHRVHAAGSYHYFNADFLRWMLSDGAGAVVLEDKPAPSGVSLRVEWVSLTSYASQHPTCMYWGLSDPNDIRVGKTFLSVPNMRAAEDAGMMVIRQDTKLLAAAMQDMLASDVKRMVDQGWVDPEEVDHFFPHASSFLFWESSHKKLLELGIDIPLRKWFTNLEKAGNTGSASIFLILEEALREGRVKPGEKVLVLVPESARFSVAQALFVACGPEGVPEHASGRRRGGPAVVTEEEPEEALGPLLRGVSEAELSSALASSPLGLEFAEADNRVTRYLARALALVWRDFSARLDRVPVLRAVEEGTASREDYKALLYNIRQQVKEGGRWIAQAAASMSQPFFEVRSALIRHAAEEHRDFLMLEADYVAMGGALSEIKAGEKNVGSEALSSFIFHEAKQPDPIQLFGAMFIIEGVGGTKAGRWATRLKESLGLSDRQVSFLTYHGANDDEHFDKLRMVLSAPFITMRIAKDIVRTAQTVGRLYALQYEELGNFCVT